MEVVKQGELINDQSTSVASGLIVRGQACQSYPERKCSCPPPVEIA